jgi:hypothetical protein
MARSRKNRFASGSRARSTSRSHCSASLRQSETSRSGIGQSPKPNCVDFGRCAGKRWEKAIQAASAAQALPRPRCYRMLFSAMPVIAHRCQYLRLAAVPLGISPAPIAGPASPLVGMPAYSTASQILALSKTTHRVQRTPGRRWTKVRSTADYSVMPMCQRATLPKCNTSRNFLSRLSALSA